jgi:hypothetical protein
MLIASLDNNLDRRPDSYSKKMEASAGFEPAVEVCSESPWVLWRLRGVLTSMEPDSWTHATTAARQPSQPETPQSGSKTGHAEHHRPLPCRLPVASPAVLKNGAFRSVCADRSRRWSHRCAVHEEGKGTVVDASLWSRRVVDHPAGTANDADVPGALVVPQLGARSYGDWSEDLFASCLAIDQDDLE